MGGNNCGPHNGEDYLDLQKAARRSGPLLLVTYRCRSFGRAALWDFYHPSRGPGSAGPVSGRRLVADSASGPAFVSAGRVGFGSSSCFLSWLGTTAQNRRRSDKIEAAIRIAAIM
jgi:hypothetical protein